MAETKQHLFPQYPILLSLYFKLSRNHYLEGLVLKTSNIYKCDSGGFFSRRPNQVKEKGARPTGLVVSIVLFGYDCSLWLVSYPYGKANLKDLARTS